MRRPKSKVVAIVQARMGATRLYGKPLKKVLEKPLLAYLIERLKACQTLNQIVIATTLKKEDDAIVALAKKSKVKVFRGSENDVLQRYFGAAQLVDADIIVRITGDCPLIDPKLIDHLVDFYLKNRQNYDYVSNTLKRTYPRGMDLEVFSLKALKEANSLAQKFEEREHVTPYIYRHPEIFKLANIEAKEDNSSNRWTVDTPEDLELITKMIQILYPKKPNFTLNDLLALIKKQPELSLINAHIEQKKI